MGIFLILSIASIITVSVLRHLDYEVASFLAIIPLAIFVALTFMTNETIVYEDEIKTERGTIVSEYAAFKDKEVFLEKATAFNEKIEKYQDRKKSFWHNAFCFIENDTLSEYVFTEKEIESIENEGLKAFLGA